MYYYLLEKHAPLYILHVSFSQTTTAFVAGFFNFQKGSTQHSKSNSNTNSKYSADKD